MDQGEMKMHSLKLDGMKQLHIISENINYPVAIPVYNGWQEIQIKYLLENIKTTRFSSYDICKWCVVHGFQYGFVYPLCKDVIFKHPYKYFKFLEMKYKLKWFALAL